MKRIFVFLVGFAIIGTSLLLVKRHSSPLALVGLNPTFGVTVDPGLSANQRQRVLSALDATNIKYRLVSAQADLEFSSHSSPTATVLESVLSGTPQKLSTNTLLKEITIPTVSLSGKDAQLVTAIVKAYQPPKQEPTWTVNALGDVIIGRTVYKVESSANDYTSSFSKMAAATKNADLTVANLESVLSDNVEHPTLGMTFSAPSKAADGLVSAGISAVNLANNHSYNYGDLGFRDTMATLKERNIGYFGGGVDAKTAHAPLMVTVKGKKIALLGYSSIIGSYEALGSKSGQAWLSMAPWGTFDEQLAVQMENDIKAAKAQSDLVFVYYHWGTEYTHDAGAEQRTVAHRAVDAGADVILGTHPHWVQGVEWYKDKLITYSLGNFVFDQEWSTETKQGTFLSLKFQGNSVIGASLTPFEIEHYNRPEPVDPVKANKILQDVYGHSWWPAV